jgi:hypothetical protein
LQLLVSNFQVEDVCDSGEVHALVDQLGDAGQALEVVVTVAARAAI